MRLKLTITSPLRDLFSKASFRCLLCLRRVGLSQLATFALHALHIDYNDPQHQKLYDWIGKNKWPASCKQLYRWAVA